MEMRLSEVLQKYGHLMRVFQSGTVREENIRDSMDGIVMLEPEKQFNAIQRGMLEIHHTMIIPKQPSL